MSTASWDIYAEQMAHLKYGFPLWSPDPPPGGAPIELGDVGWVREGEFIPLFNAFRDSDDRQPHGRVPAGFSPLSLQDMMIRGPREKVSATMLCSRGIKSRNVSAGVAVNAGTPSSPSGTIDFSFECYEDSGALLVPRPRMMEHVILSTRPIRAYMETHFDTWFEFGAHTLGFDIKEDDIRFVIGTMKTSQWEVAAFRGHSRKMIGHFSGALGSGAAHLAMSTSDFRPAEVHHRAGPPGRLEHQLQADGDSTASSAGLGEQSSELGAAPTPVVYDQCVFIHYYKRKRRRLPPFGFRLKGGAGPSELPRRPEDDRGLSPELVNVGGAREDGSYGRGDCLSPSSVSDDDSESEDVTVDPVDYLLDYILQKTSSDTAIASDLELYASLGRHWQPWWPEDLESALEHNAPAVDVSESGAGSICLPEETSYELPQIAEPESLAEIVDQGGDLSSEDHYGKGRQRTKLAYQGTSDSTSARRERARARWRYAVQTVRQRLRDGRIRRDPIEPANAIESRPAATNFVEPTHLVEPPNLLGSMIFSEPLGMDAAQGNVRSKKRSPKDHKERTPHKSNRYIWEPEDRPTGKSAVTKTLHTSASDSALRKSPFMR